MILDGLSPRILNASSCALLAIAVGIILLQAFQANEQRECSAVDFEDDDAKEDDDDANGAVYGAAADDGDDGDGADDGNSVEADRAGQVVPVKILNDDN